MNLEEIEKRWKKSIEAKNRHINDPDTDELEFGIIVDIDWLIQKVKSLESDLSLNKSLLARQCDLAREAEAKAMEAQAELTRIHAMLENVARVEVEEPPPQSWIVTEKQF